MFASTMALTVRQAESLCITIITPTITSASEMDVVTLEYDNPFLFTRVEPCYFISWSLLRFSYPLIIGYRFVGYWLVFFATSKNKVHEHSGQFMDFSFPITIT